MNSTVLSNIARFFFLILLQVLLLNNINFLGYVNPYLYVLFIILYPFNGNQTLFLLLCFLLGLGVDIFEDSGGINAAACLVVAYIRPAILRFSFGVSYEYQTIRINERLTPERFSFILISVVTHHLILYLLEVFRFSLILDIIIRTVLTTVFTLILCITIIYLIKPGKQ